MSNIPSNIPSNKASDKLLIKQLSQLEAKLQYRFVNKDYLLQALTHRSKHSQNNERLEFLGDAILGFVIAGELYQRYPMLSEGRLSRCRASLVNGVTLAALAREINLGDHLQLGPGELKSGGWRRDSTLADATEAIIGAIYLDAGLEAARQFVLQRFEQSLLALEVEKDQKDAKTRLQEYLQARQCPLPNYDLVEVEGKDHDCTFLVNCNVSVLTESVPGRGNTRRRAEQQAAANTLQRITQSSQD